MNLIKHIFQVFLTGFLPALFFVGILLFSAFDRSSSLYAKQNLEEKIDLNVKDGDVLLGDSERNIILKNGIEIRISKNSELYIDHINKNEVELVLERGEVWVNSLCSRAVARLRSKQVLLESSMGSFGLKYEDDDVEVFSGNGFPWVRIFAKGNTKELIRSFVLPEKQTAKIYEGNLGEVFRNVLYSKLEKEFKISFLDINKTDEASVFLYENRKKDLTYCISRKSDLDKKIKKISQELGLENSSKLFLFLRSSLTFDLQKKSQNSFDFNKNQILKVLNLSTMEEAISRVEKFATSELKLFQNDFYIENFTEALRLVQEFSFFVEEKKFPYEKKKKFISILRDPEESSAYMLLSEALEFVEKINEGDKQESLKILKKSSKKNLEFLAILQESGKTQEALEWVEMWKNILKNSEVVSSLGGEEVVKVEKGYEDFVLDLITDKDKNYSWRLDFALRKLDLMGIILEEIFTNRSLEKLHYAKSLLESYQELNLEENTKDDEKRVQFARKISPINIRIQFLSSLAGNERKISEENFLTFKETAMGIMDLTPIFSEVGISIAQENIELIDSSMEKLLIKNASFSIQDREVGFSCIYNTSKSACSNFRIPDYREIHTMDKEVEVSKIKGMIKKILF